MVCIQGSCWTNLAVDRVNSIRNSIFRLNRCQFLYLRLYASIALTMGGEGL